ncbi:hypothetical protein [Streptomyces yerevanensis]|uniref:hypothetical protein n=1 Tax=Streptomyces yerevanensis TaxID=66378 RepID=UPI0005278FB2|nr:hypothetical protein [Streptomyces yerevanensis]
MNRYALTVRRWWAVPPTLAVIVVVCWAVGTSEVPIPSLVGGMDGARLAYFTPILAVVAVMYCMERRLREAERTAVVPIRRLDHGAVILTAVLAHGAGVLVGMDVARNITLLLALALLVRRVANEAAAAASGMALLIGTLIAGRAYQPGGSATHTWWALPLYPAGSATAWLITVAVFALVLLASP